MFCGIAVSTPLPSMPRSTGLDSAPSLSPGPEVLNDNADYLGAGRRVPRGATRHGFRVARRGVSTPGICPLCYPARRGWYAHDGDVAPMGTGSSHTRAHYGSPACGAVASVFEVLPTVRPRLSRYPFELLWPSPSAAVSAHLHRSGSG